MKKILQLLFLFSISLLCNSCIYGDPPDSPNTNSNYKPLIINRAELESSIKSLPPQPIVKSGKIYIKNDLMFVNDVNKGFHIYNYTDPEKPILMGYIQTLGATDLAIKNNLIYVNQAVDLVTLEYNSSNNTLTEKHRNKNVFPQKIAPDGQHSLTTDNEIIIDWEISN